MQKLKRNFWLSFGIFLLFAVLSFVLKYYKIVPDYLESDNFLLFLSPIIVIISILLPSYLYGQKVKHSKEAAYRERKENFVKSQIIKFWSYLASGVFVAVMQILFYKKEYVYLEAIILMFYLMNLPSTYFFKRDFSNKQT